MFYTNFKARTALLLASGNPSAIQCANDAEDCYANAENGEPHPLGAHWGTTETDAQLWTRAAQRWQTKGAQHAWGYDLPAGWDANVCDHSSVSQEKPEASTNISGGWYCKDCGQPVK